MSAAATTSRPAVTERELMGVGLPTSPVVGVAMALSIAAAPAIVLAILVARSGMTSSWVIPLGVLTVCLNLLVILMDMRYGLALFIVCAGLSPRLVSDLRVEDFLFVLIFISWVMKMARARHFPVVKSSIVTPFVILTVIGIASSLNGVYAHTIPEPTKAIFLTGKRLEYFFIFWVVATTIRSETWLRVLTLAFVLSGALAAIYGLMHARQDTYLAVSSARVSGPEGENYNTLSGYLVICIAAGVAGIGSFRKTAPRLLLIGATGIACMGLLFSFSREGYVMLAGALAVFAFTRYRSILIVGALALGVALCVSPPVREHLQDTFTKISESRTADVGTNSLTARYRAWNYIWLNYFLPHPVLGIGVGGVNLDVDNEYILRATEAGVIGFAAFVWWLAAVGLQIWKINRARGFPRALALALTAAFVGMLIQGFAAASFTTIRTMEPFWFLLGLGVAGLATYREQQERHSEQAPPAAAGAVA